MKYFGRVAWWFLYRFHPSHRYNIIKTGLPAKYHDPDIRIEAALVSLFMEWYASKNKEAIVSGKYSSYLEHVQKCFEDGDYGLKKLQDFIALDAIYQGYFGRAVDDILYDADEDDSKLQVLFKLRGHFWY